MAALETYLSYLHDNMFFYLQCYTQETITCLNLTVRMKMNYSLKNRSLRNRLPVRCSHTQFIHTNKSAKFCVVWCMLLLKWDCLSQLAYQAWVTSVKTALRERQNRQGRLKRTEREERADSHEALSVKGWIYLHRFLIRYWITWHPWSQTGKIYHL